MGYFMVIHPLVIPWFAMIWHGKYTIWGIHREYVSLVWRNVREKIWNYTLKTWTYVYNNYIKDWGQSTQIPIFYSQCDIEKFLNMENWRIPSFSRDTQCKRLTFSRDWWSVASQQNDHRWNQESLVGGDWNHGILWFSIYLEFHNANWRTLILQRGWNHQPTIMKVWRFFIGDLTTGKSLKQGDDPQWSSVWFRGLGYS